MKSSKVSLMAMALAASLTALTFAGEASALDASKDRRGAFAGLGVGGGVAVEDGEPAGALMWDAQLGGGATNNLTLALDVDFWLQWYEHHRNFMVSPGPEVSYFIGDTGLYAQLGIGVGLKTRVFEERDIATVEDTREFDAGFDVGAAFGWEFFLSSNVALGLSIHADYVVIRPENLLMAGFSMALKYY
jgi:hypothetical protein